MMKVINENQLRGCIQEAQRASVALTQAIAGIETSAVQRSLREAQVFRLLKANAQAIKMLLSVIELTGQDEVQLWPTR
jgi:hypothetical protein